MLCLLNKGLGVLAKGAELLCILDKELRVLDKGLELLCMFDQGVGSVGQRVEAALHIE